MSEQTFSLSLFKTVFDPAPEQRLATLAELTEELQRFLVKPDLQRLVERELRLVDSALEALEAGLWQAGPQLAALRRARDEAEERGEPIDPAVEAAAEGLRHEARKAVKERLPCWSPTLYPPGSARGSDKVLALSCLVLDYDDGSDPDEASQVWSSWFHVLHSSWSHTPERPRFRLVLPLAAPVPVQDWQRVWAWAEEHCGRAIDPRCKGAGRMWTLPALASEDCPRVAFARGGALLDALEQLPARPALLHSSRHLKPSDRVVLSPEPEGQDAPPAEPAPPPPPARGHRPEDPATLVGLLERLSKLHRDGELSDEEFAAAKKRVL